MKQFPVLQTSNECQVPLKHTKDTLVKTQGKINAQNTPREPVISFSNVIAQAPSSVAFAGWGVKVFGR